MRLIGLTGGIACGKSTVSELLKTKGAFIVDADQIAHQIVEPGQPALEEIVGKFGTVMLTEKGELDRQKLASVVFQDSQKRKELEAITHRRVGLEMERLIREAQTLHYEVVVLDVPLLFESGWHRRADEVWVVAIIDQTVQKKRLIERNGFSEADAEQRIAAQMSQTEKIRRATRVIDNSGSLEDLKRAVDTAWLAAIHG